MKRPPLTVTALGLLALLAAFLVPGAVPEAREEYDIVIYGGSPAACAAAVTAAADAPSARIALVVPYATKAYGGLATAGGQNFWDVRRWEAGFPQEGSFGRWYAQTGHFYSTRELADLLAAEIIGLANVRTFWQTDVEAVQRDVKGRPTRLWLRGLERGPEGFLRWGKDRRKIEARILVDASDDGRLARLAGVPVSSGRADWPAAYLEEGEGRSWAARQQAATLMFQVTGVRPGRYPDMIFLEDEDGTWGAYGGLAAYLHDPVIAAFNRRYGPQGFALKPLNAAQDGTGSGRWWVNALLVFNVDGRAVFRDRGSGYYPRDLPPQALETDRAWVRARRLLKSPAFLAALRRFDGFGQVKIVLAGDGLPATGDFLYLRETVHSRASEQQAAAGPPNTEETLYAVTPREIYLAGGGPGDGADLDNYATRIGLGFYWMDINAYRYRDLLDDGGFRWPVTAGLRPDYPGTTPGPGARPKNPVYLPYEVLINPKVPEILLPGAAAAVSSLAWAELRVLPNWAVLGDAAGAAAALALEKGLPPGRLGPDDIATLQRRLVSRHGARLEKDRPAAEAQPPPPGRE